VPEPRRCQGNFGALTEGHRLKMMAAASEPWEPPERNRGNLTHKTSELMMIFQSFEMRNTRRMPCQN
jgi:hypothetical protein